MDTLRDMLDKRTFEVLSVVLQKYNMQQDVCKEDVDDWLASLTDILPRLGRTERRHLIELFVDIPRLRLARCICDAVDHLPMERPEVLRQWMAPAIERAPRNIEAAAAFLSLQSSSALERLDKLLGQVRFDDCRRLFQLYAEGMLGQKLGIEPTSGWADNFRDLPWTDGRTVYLPAMVGRYETWDENFRWYKVSLLHQLGYYEFGTFSNPDLVFADYFAAFSDPHVAASMFQILEDARIDWKLERRYRGAAVDIRRLKADALSTRIPGEVMTDRSRLLEAMLQYSLDGNDFDFAGAELGDVLSDLFSEMSRLKYDARLADTLNVLVRCYQLIAPYLGRQEEINQAENDAQREEGSQLEAVSFRGNLDADSVSLNIPLIEDPEVIADGQEPPLPGSNVDTKNVNIQQFNRGEVNGEGVVLTEAHAHVESAEKTQASITDEAGSMKERSAHASGPPVEERTWQYDEWDFLINDYRRRWCTLFEIRESEDHPEFVDDALREHRSVALRVRRQLNMLKPELLRKVKGVVDGEEIDLERAVEAVVDRRSGVTPGERIYIQKQKRERDVSALFLLDMSASTDDAIPGAEAEQKTTQDQLPGDEDDFLTPFDTRFTPSETGLSDPVERIIDVEKQAVVLMAEALKDLGDSYSICGFSGYGRERVDFFLCKDFDEPFNQRVKGRIGGIKPCRSTRMGPAIRHATHNLCQTGSKVQALIIISDGYPQDFDYGTDRNSKEYGIRDTTRALAEARHKGVQTFCLTVDPSGHDYLREMCRDQQYMVIQEIAQLPNELSKVYRALTS